MVIPDIVYRDVDKAVEFCKTSIPTSALYRYRINFHSFWKGPRPFGHKHTLLLKSYLLTQNLDNTRFCLWGEESLLDNEYFKPFLGLIDFHVIDLDELSHNTPLSEYKYLHSSDSKKYLDSDLFRVLVLNKFGGLFIDLDSVLFRDFSPLFFDSYSPDYSFAYYWGNQLDRINNAILFSLSGSPLCQFLINSILSTKPQQNSTCWGSDIITEAYKIGLLTAYPTAFFNTEWQYPDSELDKDSELKDFVFYPMKKTRYSNTFFHGVFSWHWHGNWNVEVEEGSKFYKLDHLFSELICARYGIDV